MANRNVRVVKSNGRKPVIKQYSTTASTAFDQNSLVEFASGVVNPSDDNDTAVFGVILEGKLVGDTATTVKLVEVLQPGDEVELDFTAAASAPTVGTTYGISNAYTVDQADTSNKVVTITAVVEDNSTSGRVRGVFKTYLGANGL